MSEWVCLCVCVSVCSCVCIFLFFKYIWKRKKSTRLFTITNDMNMRAWNTVCVCEWVCLSFKTKITYTCVIYFIISFCYRLSAKFDVNSVEKRNSEKEPHEHSHAHIHISSHNTKRLCNGISIWCLIWKVFDVVVCVYECVSEWFDFRMCVCLCTRFQSAI